MKRQKPAKSGSQNSAQQCNEAANAPEQNENEDVLYTFDFETDPFKPWVNVRDQRIPKPFAVGVYCINTNVYEWYWGQPEDVIDFLMSCMEAAPPGSIWYAHNGGKFDVHFFKEEIKGAMKIIGARIVECQVRNVVVRDSFAMLPVALKKFGGKVDIDIEKLEPEVRERHKPEILHYMEQDCRVLAKAIVRFRDEFGLRLTMAGAAMKQLERFHEFERIASVVTDETFRDYYFGGRVECIESGSLPGKWKIYDVNSMYPAVMRNFEHPVSSGFITYKDAYATAILPRCDFADVTAINDGCLPAIVDGKLSFRLPKGRFKATGHEIRAGLETGTLKILKVHAAYKAEKHASFAAFVDHFFHSRIKAREAGDDLLDLFYKLVMNSAYGKFAQNPERFKDWIATDEILETADGWVLEHEFPDGHWRIWSRPSTTPAHLQRFNVATAASITGAARAQLWRGLCAAKRPVYCDTDSMICEDFQGDIDAKRLGAWKPEGSGDRLAIAGRKLYALFDNGKPVKQASKGVRIAADAIARVADGDEIEHRNDAPTFSLRKSTHFIRRKVRKTA